MSLNLARVLCDVSTYPRKRMLEHSGSANACSAPASPSLLTTHSGFAASKRSCRAILAVDQARKHVFAAGVITVVEGLHGGCTLRRGMAMRGGAWMNGWLRTCGGWLAESSGLLIGACVLRS